jgi:hypothetical protein
VPRIVLLIMLFILVPAMIASAAIKPENFVGVWLLDEGKGNLAADSSGNGNDGQITGTKWVDGKFGKALVFDDAGDVKIESNEMLNLGDKFTMMAYFYANALDDWHQIIAKDAEYLLRIDPPAEGKNMSAFVSIAGAWEPRASAGVPDTKTWYHFAATYDSKTTFLTVYVDGEKKGQSARAGNELATNNPVTLGNWGGSSNFKGIIDDVAILNKGKVNIVQNFRLGVTGLYSLRLQH